MCFWVVNVFVRADAVIREANHLGLPAELAGICCTPTLVTPRWEEGTANGGVDQDKAVVLLDQHSLIRIQNLATDVIMILSWDSSGHSNRRLTRTLGRNRYLDAERLGCCPCEE